MPQRKHAGALTPSQENRHTNHSSNNSLDDFTPPVRKVVTRRGGHTRCLLPSIKNPIASGCESQWELRCGHVLELSSRVSRYETQPSREKIQVGGVPTIYIPDFKIYFADRTVAFCEVKPAVKCKVAHIASRLSAIREHFQNTGRQFFLVTDEWLSREPRSSNLMRLMYHRRACLLDDARKERLMSEVYAKRPETIAELEEELGRENAWLLMGLGCIGVDLEQAMTATTPIYLEGGHRHADFCS